MTDEFNESAEEYDTPVFDTRAMKVLFELINNSAAPPAVNLSPLQKQLPTTYLAILNAHGNYGYGRNQRAFIAARFVLDGSDAQVEFPDLPRSTTRVVMRGAGLAAPISLDVDWEYNTALVPPITASDAFLVGFIQALDNQDVLLAIGLPTIANPTQPAGYPSVF